ncbi:DUF4232 domain-containing protein [uncultured Rothia sp.]|uniref:DUF4232 domain-containing protein n=1 Tax=uncultured Rothia sp. TaxID=316088 RepID=UPI0028CFEE52|nr:DUF4232 domain-containing protein [uncultured Rothia sp.]
MFKSAQVLASTTLLCGVLALSGCGASQAGQEAEGTSAQPSASASVKPGTIRVASDGATSSVTPGSITVVNSPEAENHGSSSEHSDSHTETHESKQNSDSHSSGSSQEGSEQNKSDDSADSQQDSQKSSNSSSQSDSHSSNGSSHSSESSRSSSSSNSSNSSDRSSNSSNNTAEGPGQCDLDDLNISVSIGDGSPGARNYTLYFQNSSDSSCTLRGYPRVVHAGPSGTWVGREASTSDEYMNSAGVTLNPGDSTTAVLRSVYPARFGDACGSRPVQGFLVGLPSGSGGVIVPLDTTACSSSVPQLSVGQFGAR